MVVSCRGEPKIFACGVSKFQATLASVMSNTKQRSSVLSFRLRKYRKLLVNNTRTLFLSFIINVTIIRYDYAAIEARRVTLGYGCI